MKTPLTIIMPMAGRSGRFQGFHQGSKYYLSTVGKPMYHWALLSLPYNKAHRIITICLEKDREIATESNNKLPELIKNKVEMVFIPDVLSGPAKTISVVLPSIDSSNEVIISHADQYLDWHAKHFIEYIWREKPDGCIPVVPMDVDDWGYIVVDMKTGEVARVSEKVKISYYATCGVYYFRSQKILSEALEDEFEHFDNIKSEYYIGSAFNYMIGRSCRVLPYYFNRVVSMNNPDDFRAAIPFLSALSEKNQEEDSSE